MALVLVLDEKDLITLNTLPPFSSHDNSIQRFKGLQVVIGAQVKHFQKGPIRVGEGVSRSLRTNV